VRATSERATGLAVGLALILVAGGADWPRFRGPDAAGVAASQKPPSQWDATAGVVWKTKLPGAGASSPVITGNKLLLTTYNGYGLSQDDPGDIKKLARQLVCFDLATGKILWQKNHPADQPEREYRGFTALHGYASGTPVTDGKNVYAFFGRSGVFAYDLEGKALWKASVGTETHDWSSGTSPILFENLVIVNASVESSSIVALDKATGKEVWRTPGIKMSWSTPLVVKAKGGRFDLVVSLKGEAWGLDPLTGKKRWSCTTVDDYVCPSIVAHDDVCFVTGGRKPTAVAVRVGGEGDVTESGKVWDLKKGPRVVPTPLYHEGLLYWVDNRGLVACVDAQTGTLVYENRLEIPGGGDKVYASMVLADGKLYIVTRQGGTIVLAAGREFKELARNDLDDKSIFNATPAIHGDRLYLRSDTYLYCLGK